MFSLRMMDILSGLKDQHNKAKTDICRNSLFFREGGSFSEACTPPPCPCSPGYYILVKNFKSFVRSWGMEILFKRKGHFSNLFFFIKNWAYQVFPPLAINQKRKVLQVYTIRKCINDAISQLCGEIFDHFPLFDETFLSHRALQQRYQSNTAKSD